MRDLVVPADYRDVAVNSSPRLADARSAQQPSDHRSAGRRLLDAFDAFERFPAFAAARGQLLKSGITLGDDAVSSVESDLALTVAVLRKANSDGTRPRIA